MKRFAVLALAVTAALSGAQVDASKARALLAQGMSRRSVVNIRAIIVQRVGYSSNVMQQVKVDMSKDGKIHQLVLAPLSMQGMERVDDTRQIKSYSPDEGLLIVQPSPAPDYGDVQFRMKLVDRNYTLKVERKQKIAGRQAVVIAAVPKYKELETRCYSIDEETGFLLRLETCRPGGDAMLHFDTKMVEYPAKVSNECFEINSKWTRTKSYEARAVVPKAASLRDIPFQPVVPTRLPMGFAVQEFEADIDSKTPSVAVRMTDGLAMATLYQWSSKGRKALPAPMGTLVRDAGSVRLLIAGDIPDNVKQRLIDAFVQASKGGQGLRDNEALASWVQELGLDVLALPMDGDLEQGDLILIVQDVQ